MYMLMFFALLLLYPVFLQLVHITDLRAIPILAPYTIGCLAVTLIVSAIIDLFRKKEEEPSP